MIAVSGLSGSAAAADKWIEVKTPNFTVVSNAGAGEKRLLQTAVEFEQVRAAYAKVWPQGKLSLSKPTMVPQERGSRSAKPH